MMGVMDPLVWPILRLPPSVLTGLHCRPWQHVKRGRCGLGASIAAVRSRSGFGGGGVYSVWTSLLSIGLVLLGLILPMYEAAQSADKC